MRTQPMLRSLIAAVLSLLAAAGHPVAAQPVQVPPGHVLVDDMILPAGVVWGDSSFTATPWTFGVVAYVFNANVTPANRTQALKAMDEIAAVCGVNFVPRTAHPDWIVFNAATFNSSMVGMQGGGQTINITSWNTKYIIVHEIMHALGFVHEQSRPDRDAFVTVNFGNISTNGCPGSNCGGNGSASCVCNFNIINGVTYATPYDFLSIMHYGRNTFSSNGLDTITCQPAFGGFQNQIGNRTFMSLGDAQGLRQRYGATVRIPSLSFISPSTVTTTQGSFVLHLYGSGFFEGSPNASGVQGSKILWNGAPIATTYVDAGHLTAVVSGAMISRPQTVQVSVTNPSPGWGPTGTQVPLAVTCQTGGLALTNGAPTTVTNGCQAFSITPVYNTFNVVGVSSSTDWDIQMGTAMASAGGTTCDFVAGSGWFGPGTIQPNTGNVTLYSGSAPATLQHVTSTELLNGQPTLASMPAGSIVRAFHFGPAAVSTRRIEVAGPGNLRWKLLWSGSTGGGFNWRSSTTNVVASGVVGGGPVGGIGVVPAPYCLVVYSDGGPIAASAGLTITMCFDFTPAPLASSNTITTINQGPYSCVPFTIAPLLGRWNVVGVSSPSDWDIQIGPAVSQSGGSACDYVLANGHLGSITPLTGVCSPYDPLGSPGSLQFAPTATMPSANSIWNSYTYMMVAFEFEVVTPGTYDIAVGAPGYLWDLHLPGANQGWRRKADRASGGHAGNGTAVTRPGLTPGWHCVVLYHDGGPTGLTNPSISVGLSASQAPVLSALVPASATAGTPGITLRATGNGFTATSVLQWNGNALATTLVSTTELAAAVPAPFLVSPGSALVTVATPGVGTSTSLPFAIVPALPVLSQISPASFPAGGVTFTLSAFGTGFNASSMVLWNGAPLPTTYVHAGELSATVAASFVATLGLAQVSVENPGIGTSNVLPFGITNGVPGLPPVVAPGLEPLRTWSATALGIPTPLGGLAFNAAGDTLVVGGFANNASGSLQAIPVNRDPATQQVTGLGAPAYLALAPHIDGGVAERGGTWFYTQHPINSVGQFNGVSSVSTSLPGGLASTGGLTFVPPGFPNAGDLLVSSFSQGGIYAIPVTPAGNGFFTLGAATLWAALPGGLEGLAFIASGPFAGDLLVVDYSYATVSVLDVDPVTGLPAGGPANPSVTTIIPYWYGAEGVAVDPLTGDLWITQFGDMIVQIAGLDSMRTLVTRDASVSVNAGASIELKLRAGTANRGRSYVLAGSLSGTSPGIPAGTVVIPLNLDAFTWFVLENLNGPLYVDFATTLDDHGAGRAILEVPPGLGFQGPLATDWAYVLLDPFDFASDPLHLTLLP